MTINELKKALKVLFKSNVATLIHGQHGIGKSQSIKQLADEEGMQLIDLRLGSQDVADLIGLQEFKRDDKGNIIYTKFYMPEWFPRDPKSRGIIFLDELNRAHRDVLQAIFQLILDKRLHVYELPKGWNVVAAINPNTDDYVVTDLADKALLSRFCHIKLNPSNKEFFDYADKKFVNRDFINFLKEHPVHLRENIQFNLDFVKPDHRAWEALDRLNTVAEELNAKDVVEELSMGMVGTEAWASYKGYLASADKPLEAEDILSRYSKVKDKVLKYSNYDSGVKGELIKITCDNLVDTLKTKKEVTDKEAKNLSNFILDIPSEQAYSFLKNVIDNKNVMEALNDKKFVAKLKDKVGKK